MIYTVYSSELDEIKFKTKDLKKAVTEAIEWAEYDDLIMDVIDDKGDTHFTVNGYAEATEYLEMENE